MYIYVQKSSEEDKQIFEVKPKWVDGEDSIRLHKIDGMFAQWIWEDMSYECRYYWDWIFTFARIEGLFNVNRFNDFLILLAKLYLILLDLNLRYFYSISKENNPRDTIISIYNWFISNYWLNLIQTPLKTLKH